MVYNPERRAWRGRSYRKGGERVRDLRDRELRTEEHDLPKYRLTEEAKKTDLRVTRPFTITVTQDLDFAGRWIAHVIGPDGLDNITWSEPGNGPMQGPIGAVEMAADLLDAVTNRCQKSEDGEHVYDVETVMQELDYESPGLDHWEDTEEPAIGCSICGTRQRRSDFELVPVVLFLNERHEIK